MLSLGPSWSTSIVSGQPELYSVTLSQKEEKLWGFYLATWKQQNGKRLRKGQDGVSSEI